MAVSLGKAPARKVAALALATALASFTALSGCVPTQQEGGSSDAPATAAGESNEPQTNTSGSQASEPQSTADGAQKADASHSTGTLSVTVKAVARSVEEFQPVSTTVELPAGSTALDALKATGLDVEAVTGPYNTYVSSVEGLSLGDYSSTSGWRFFVNGEEPDEDCTKCTLKDGDLVEWVYFV